MTRAREWAPKFADPGTTLTVTGYQNDAPAAGIVWSSGPGTGTRWLVLEDGSLSLVKVGFSGRDKGEVRELVRRPRDWQAQVVRALGALSRAPGVRASDHERWVPMDGHRDGGYTHKWARFHLRDCAQAVRPLRSHEIEVGFGDGTVSRPNIAAGWHRWLLANLAARQGHGWDCLDLCECITGAPETVAA
jgi:hypothetical protein